MTPHGLRAELSRRTLEREYLIVNRLVGKHLAGTLTGEDARAGIAEIAGLRGMLRDLDAEERVAQPV